MTIGGKIRVLIVDDSPLVCEAIKAILTSDHSIDIVGIARNGAEAVQKSLALRPSVITMDLNMPIMGGLEAIQRIMEDNPTPIVVVSSIDPKITIKALGMGAMDFVSITDDINHIAQSLIEKVKIASRVRPIRRINIAKAKAAYVERKAPSGTPRAAQQHKVVAIGISTGGPQALQVLFSGLPYDLPATILVVQHISRGFVGGLVEWLHGLSNMAMKVAASGDPLKPSTVLFAPDDYHLGVDPDGKIVLHEDIGRKASHVPSIDFMMQSVAEVYGNRVLGVLMTGMGQDGVKGMSAIKRSGGTTVAQDEKSSVIFGMNKAAIECNCVDRVVPLEELADVIKGYCGEGRV
jgi:two-component system chemotaxis response regulator CheB